MALIKIGTNGLDTGVGGKVLQVVQGTTNTQVANATTSYVDTNLTATITPSSASNKILVLVHQNGIYKSNVANNSVNLKLFRGATEISFFANYAGATTTTTALGIGSSSVAYLDSPATTNATTYKTQLANQVAASFVSVQQDNTQLSTITLIEIEG